jgi:arylsulfatase A-like enzyme
MCHSQGLPTDYAEFMPLRTALMHIPLFLRLPRQRKKKRFRQIVQPWDLHPTLLELFGCKVPDGLNGESLLNLIDGRDWKSRSYAFNATGRGHRQAINRDWIYTWWEKDLREPNLIDLKNNPRQNRNVWKKHPDVCKKMHNALARFDPAIPIWGGK